MKRFALVVSALIFVSGVLFAQNVMTPELLWKLGRVSLDDISPDGKYALYGITTYDMGENKGTRHIYKVSLKGGAAERIHPNTEESEHGGHFVGSSNQIAFQQNNQLYLVSGKDEPKAVTQIRDGISNARLIAKKDGYLLVFTKSVPLEKWEARRYDDLDKANFRLHDDLMYRHWDHWKNDKVSHLCYTEIGSEILQPVSSFTDLMEGQPYSIGGGAFDISSNGEMLVYSLKRKTGKAYAQSTNSEVFLVRIKERSQQKISGDNKGYDQSASFSPDGKWISWLSMPRDGFEADERSWVFYNTENGNINRTDADYWHSYAWADNQTIYATVDENATQPIRKLQLKLSGDHVKLNQSTFTGGTYNYGSLKAAKGNLIALRQDMNHAPELFTFNKKGKAEALTSVNKVVYNSIDKSTIEKRMVKTSDGKEMLVWLILPPNFDVNKQYPALLYCQGGPQSAVSQFYSFRWNFQLMAAQDYVIIAPNRRGVPGFGAEWNESISEDWGGQPIADYLSAVDELKKESYIDENRIGAVGASYGGYSVYQLAGVHEKRFKALISHCGLFHMESWYGTTEELFFADWDLGGPYWQEEVPKSYTEFSPHLRVKNWDTPLLVIHGEKDFRVPVEQGLQAYQAAQLMGVPSRLLLFPDEGHWVLQPQNAMVWHSEFFTWLNQWLKK